MFLGILFFLSLLIVGIHHVRATPSAYQWQSQFSSASPDNWQKYVRSPATHVVRPLRVLSNYTQGNVTNPIGLLTGKSTVFTRAVPASNATGEDVAPMIVVDFGQNIVGFLSISFGGSYNSTPGLPSIRLAFSETLEYLTDVSDFSRSYNVRFHFIFQPHIMTFLRETQSPQAVTR
jgi:hypothetical protein